MHPTQRLAAFYSDRSGSLGRGDIYLVRWENDSWGTPVNAGPIVNGPGYNWAPSFSPDGQILYYAIYQNGDSNIVEIALDTVLKSME